MWIALSVHQNEVLDRYNKERNYVKHQKMLSYKEELDRQIAY